MKYIKDISFIFSSIGNSLRNRLLILVILSITVVTFDFLFAVVLQKIIYALMHPELNQKLIDLKFTSMNIDSTFNLIAFLVIGRFLCESLIKSETEYIAQKLKFRIRNVLLSNKILYFKVNIPNTRLLYLLSEVLPKSGHALVKVCGILVHGVYLIIIYSLLFWLYPKESLLITIVIAILLVFIKLLFYIAKKETAEAVLLEVRIAKKISIIIENLALVKIFRTSQAEYGELTGINLNATNMAFRSSSITKITSGVPAFVGMSIVCGWLYLNRNDEAIQPELMTSFIYLMLRFFQRATNFSMVCGDYLLTRPFFQNAMILLQENLEIANEVEQKYEKFFNYFRMRTPRKANQKNRVSKEESTPPELIFNNLGFKHINGPEVLHDINLNIKPGEHICIAGKSGSGKSTLMLLISGLINSQKGEILINNLAPNEYFDSSAGSYVGPKPYIFEGTLRDNLVYGLTKKVQDSEIIEILKELEMDGIVNRHKNGLDQL